MNEDRLRSALRAEAGSAEPTPAKWDAVRSRVVGVRSSRRMQRMAVAGLSAAALVVAGAVLFFSRPDDGRSKIAEEPEQTQSGYLISGETQRLVVRSMTDGRELKVLVEGKDAGQISGLGVSPDGSQVYFQRIGRNERCPDITNLEVVRVPIAGGPIEHVAWGAGPRVDDSGEHLVYLSTDEDGCGADSVIVRKPLAGGEQTTVVSARRDDFEGEVEAINSGADLLLARQLSDDLIPQSLIDLRGDRPKITDVRLPDGTEEPFGAAHSFVGDRMVVGVYDVDGARFVGTWDPIDGSAENRLFRLPDSWILAADATASNIIIRSESTGEVQRWVRGRGLTTVGNFEPHLGLAFARGPTKPPEHFAAVSSDGKLEIRSTADGSVVRTVADGMDVNNGTPALTVSRDGRYAYVDRMATEGECANESRAIDRVDLNTGQRSEIGMGADPSVNPQGTHIAYVLSTADCFARDTLVVRTIEGTGEQRYRSEGSRLHDPRWSPDGRLLAVTLGGADTARLVQLDTIEPEGRVLTDESAFPTIPVPDFTMIAGYVTGDEFLGLSSPEDTVEAITFGHDGEVRRRLGRVPGVADRFDAVATTDGEHALVVLSEPGAVSAGGLQTTVSVVSVGAVEPRSIGDGLVAVAWLEGPAPAERPADGAVGRPETIVASSADGPIVELDPDTGEVIRTIADREAQPGSRTEEIALSPDGEYAYFERAVADPARGCEASAPETGEIMRVHRDGGDPEPVVTGRFPTLSPDGRLLAFVSYERCDRPGRLAVIAADNGEDSQIWEAPEGYSVRRPVGWDAAGDSVRVKYGRNKEWAVGYVDTTSDERVLRVDELTFYPDSDIVLHRTGAKTRAVANYAPSEPGTYGFTENDGTDFSLGSGFIAFGGGGELLGWTADRPMEHCVYIVEHTDGTGLGLWWRTCRGNDEPNRLPGQFTSAAW